MPVTNKGKYRILDVYFRNGTEPTTFYMFLATSAAAVVADTNTKSELTEVATGNGYTAGGIAVARDSTDFDVLTEDDTNDKALVQIKDLVWTASGGNLPGSGAARYAVLTDDNGTLGSREVIGGFDLSSDRVVSSGQTLTLQNCEFDLT
ncbi:MAG: hypothetical protein LC130_23205 [Bryobacterales bacterium]|nr:hypothetical protein [Bryobacterales bacterium]